MTEKYCVLYKESNEKSVNPEMERIVEIDINSNEADDLPTALKNKVMPYVPADISDGIKASGPRDCILLNWIKI